MAFKDLRTFLDGPLELPVGGKVYIVPQLSAEAGLELQEQQKLPEKEQTQGLDSWRPLLTDAIFDEMVADGLTQQEIIRCALTVRVDSLFSRAAAEEFFGLGEIPKALVKAAEAVAGRANRRATRTAGASTTTGRGTTSSTRRSGATTSTKSTTSRSRGRAS